MAPPIYFLPNVTGAQLLIDGRLSSDVLKPLGLLNTFADVRETAQADCYVEELRGPGPDGKPGTLLMAYRADGEIVPRTGYFPEGGLQTWTRFARGDAEFYVGLDVAHLPTPIDLRRKEVLPSFGAEIDGHEWFVPIIRTREGQTHLPQDYVPDMLGNVTPEVKQTYRELWDDFAGVIDLFYPKEEPDNPDAIFNLDPTEATRRCVQALSLNYRFGFAEQAMLRVIGSHTYATILIICVDYRTVRAVVDHANDDGKKKETVDPGTKPESEDTSPGEPDDSPDTPPAEPS